MFNIIKKYFSKKLNINSTKLDIQKNEKITLSDVCDCTGEIPIKDLTDYVTLYLVSGQHTGTMIQKCLKCKRLTGFPNDNLILAIKEGTDVTLDFLTKLKEHTKKYSCKFEYSIIKSPN